MFFKELLITELILENKFEGLTCPEIAALLSPLTSAVSTSNKLKSNNAFPSNDIQNNEASIEPIVENSNFNEFSYIPEVPNEIIKKVYC